MGLCVFSEFLYAAFSFKKYFNFLGYGCLGKVIRRHVVVISTQLRVCQSPQNKEA